MSLTWTPKLISSCAASPMIGRREASPSRSFWTYTRANIWYPMDWHNMDTVDLMTTPRYICSWMASTPTPSTPVRHPSWIVKRCKGVLTLQQVIYLTLFSWPHLSIRMPLPKYPPWPEAEMEGEVGTELTVDPACLPSLMFRPPWVPSRKILPWIWRGLCPHGGLQEHVQGPEASCLPPPWQMRL